MKWKTGFYHIAYKANIPILLVGVDFKKKKIGVINSLKPTGDIKKDMLFQAIFDNINQNQKNDLKKEISLLEKDRIIEREKNEEAKINLENMMRQEKGLAPLTDLDNISETSDDEPLDILLNEAAEILNDLIVPSEIRTVYK